MIGLKHFHKKVSQILVAIKSEIPLPIPYPFEINSSSIIITIPENVSYKMMRSPFPAPTSSKLPYIPEYTYAND